MPADLGDRSAGFFLMGQVVLMLRRKGSRAVSSNDCRLMFMAGSGIFNLRACAFWNRT
jgi:hypothetical protein